MAARCALELLYSILAGLNDAQLGIMPARIFSPGKIGVVSRSGTLVRSLGLPLQSGA